MSLLLILFFKDTATTVIYTLSLHDALPIFDDVLDDQHVPVGDVPVSSYGSATSSSGVVRSEEHTSELQSRFDLVCRLLLEKKKIRDMGRAALMWDLDAGGMSLVRPDQHHAE